MLASLAWRLFQEPHAMWANVLLKKYLHTSPTNIHSQIWANVIQGWHHCQQGIKWSIGNGSYIKFWEDPWIGPDTTIRSQIYGPLPLRQQNINVASFINNNEWNLDKISFDLPINIIRIIQAIYISKGSNKIDNIFWRLTSMGKFTTKSMYNSLDTNQDMCFNNSIKYSWI